MSKPSAPASVYVVKHTKVGSVLTGGEFREGEVYAPTVAVDLERLLKLGAIAPAEAKQIDKVSPPEEG